jgi:hypothetical protein
VPIDFLDKNSYKKFIPFFDKRCLEILKRCLENFQNFQKIQKISNFLKFSKIPTIFSQGILICKFSSKIEFFFAKFKKNL